jgi:predicted NAD/FAD-dependent oxidoreductase
VKAASRIAVVGAGIAGLTCARDLAKAGHQVTVFEKSGAPGGRAATRITELGSFDHGAQFFTARDAAFVTMLADLTEAGCVLPWTPRVAAGSDAQRWLVGAPGMRSIGELLAKGLDVRYETVVTRLERLDSRGPSRWALRCVTGEPVPQPIEVTEGLFDAVVIAVPAPQARDLLDVVPALHQRLRGVTLLPCWALMLGFAERLDCDLDAIFVDGPRISFLARDSSKPGRRSGERWVAHAAHAWSEEHLNDDPADVLVKMVKAFRDASGSPVQPVHAVVHRWRYSRVDQALGEAFLWDQRQSIGVCGDWCLGARLEFAWQSGIALKDAMLHS